MRLFTGGKRWGVLCSLLASTALLMGSSIATAASNVQSYSAAKAIEIEVMSGSKLLGTNAVELGAAEASFDGTKESYGETYPVSVQLGRLPAVTPLDVRATPQKTPKSKTRRASHFYVDTGALEGYAEVTDSMAQAVGSVSDTKVKDVVRIGSVESSAIATDESAHASFAIRNVDVAGVVHVDEISGEANASLNGEPEVIINRVEFTVLGQSFTLTSGETVGIPGIAQVSLLDSRTVKEAGRAEAHGGVLEIELLKGFKGGVTVRIGGLDAVVSADA